MKSAATAFGAAFTDTTSAQAADRNAAFDHALGFIENDCVVTVDAGALVMEITTPASPIIPYCTVQGRIVGGEWETSAQAGPGQNVSDTFLLAARCYVLRRINSNEAARTAGVN